MPPAPGGWRAGLLSVRSCRGTVAQRSGQVPGLRGAQCVNPWRSAAPSWITFCFACRSPRLRLGTHPWWSCHATGQHGRLSSDTEPEFVAGLYLTRAISMTALSSSSRSNAAVIPWLLVRGVSRGAPKASCACGCGSGEVIGSWHCETGLVHRCADSQLSTGVEPEAGGGGPWGRGLESSASLCLPWSLAGFCCPAVDCVSSARHLPWSH